MTARETHALVLAIESLRLEVRSLGHAADPASMQQADQHAGWALAAARQAVETEASRSTDDEGPE